MINVNGSTNNISYNIDSSSTNQQIKSSTDTNILIPLARVIKNSPRVTHMVLGLSKYLKDDDVIIEAVINRIPKSEAILGLQKFEVEEIFHRDTALSNLLIWLQKTIARYHNK